MHFNFLIQFKPSSNPIGIEFKPGGTEPSLGYHNENGNACMKLLMDRMLPISVCDKNADIREKITINISSAEIPNRDEKVINQ